MDKQNAMLPVTSPGTEAVAKKVLSGVDELFHRVNRSIPANQQVLALSPTTLARDAIKQLGDRFYSQAPVASANKVLGVFSFRSFAKKTAEYSLVALNKHKHAPGDLTVEECMERFDFANLSDELHKHFDALERDNGLLVGTPNNMIAVLTPMDVLRYLYRIASPFVALSEIELALRTLIRSAATDEKIKELTAAVLKRQLPADARVPETLEEMTFDNYRLLVASSDTWPIFQGAFGGSRERVSAKLKDVGELRNILFHFKRSIADAEIQVIVLVRDWLLTRVEQLDLNAVGKAHE
jgi:predicted transcriptional regulator